jgi:mono/diheme cytochrome c family protein
MKIAVGTILLLLAGGTLHAQVSPDEPTSVWDGIYTSAQAARGKLLYAKSCASCHGQTLEGSGQMPALVGDGFKGDWDNQSVDNLFEKIQTTMPGDKPGSLSRVQNAEILAYILSFNNYPKGTKKKLPTDVATLQKIRFQAAKPQ